MADHGDAILKRRAAFVAASLALSGCTPARDASSEPAPSPPAPSAPTSSSASAATSASSAPPDVSPELQARYRSLDREVSIIRDELDRADKAAAQCATLASAQCDDARDDAALLVHIVEGRLRRIRYLCKAKDSAEREFQRHSNTRAKSSGETLARVEKRWIALIGAKAWDEAKWRAYQANPTPCLSIVCDEWW